MFSSQTGHINSNAIRHNLKIAMSHTVNVLNFDTAHPKILIPKSTFLKISSIFGLLILDLIPFIFAMKL